MQKGTIINILNSLMFLGLSIVLIIHAMLSFVDGGKPSIILSTALLLVILAFIHSIIAYWKCNLSNKSFLSSVILNIIASIILLLTITIINEISFSIPLRFYFFLGSITIPPISAIIYLIGFYMNLKKGDENAKRNDN